MKRFTSKLRWGFLLLGAILWLATASLASAVDVQFLEGPNEGLMTLQFDGFNVATLPSATFNILSNEAATFSADFFSNSPVGFSGSVRAFMLDDPATRRESDLVIVDFFTRFDQNIQIPGDFQSIAHVNISFESDSESLIGGGRLPDGIRAVFEDGTPQLLNDFFVTASGADASLPLNIDIWAQSDASEAVPEPASLLLLGTGLIGLVGWQFRSTKKTVA